MFNSKLAKHKKLLLFNTILLSILLIGEAIFCLYVHKQNEQIVHLTQLSTKAPVNRENKLYFSVIPSKELKDGERNGVILNCIIVNTTKHDFTDWEIKFKIPEGTSILSNLNCKLIRSPDSYLSVTSNNDYSISIPSKTTAFFGMALTFPDKINIKNISITGKYNYKVTDFIINNIILFCIATNLIALITSIIVHNVMQKKIILLNEKKLRDNAIIEQTMKSFVNFIDAKDEYTRGHSARVAKYSKAIAAQLGYDAEFQQDIFYMGLMHDIGKITIPDSILNKTSHLSAEEWEIIKMHTTNGEKLLQDFTVMPSIKDAALYHHERYDGKGYIYQLKGEAIPLTARIICVADSFDAMNTNRCYRLKYSKDRIIQELERCSGKQFDPIIANAMIELLKNDKLNSDLY